MSGSKGIGKGRGSSSTGTLRLAVAFGAGIVGVFYLIMAIVPLLGGRIEIGATAADIDAIERDGFPGAAFLEVRGGNVVFEHARVWLTGRTGEKRLFQLTAPVVSDELLAAFSRSGAAREKLDLSNLRLVAVFTGDQVAALWPEVKRRAESEEPLDVEPACLDLTGETVVAKGQLSLPTFSTRRHENLDWENARRLRHEVHHDSLGNLVKNLGIAIVLLAVSVLTFRYHRLHPTRSPPAGLDVTPVFDGLLDE